MIKKQIPVFLACVALMSCAFALPDKIISRNLFYFFGAFVLVYSFCQYKSIELRKKDLLLASGLLVVGLSQLLWKYRFPVPDEQALMSDLNYGRAGAYLVLGAVFLPFFLDMLRKLPVASSRILCFAAFLGFLYLSARGLYYYYFITESRLRIDNSATLTAYLFLLYTLMTLYIVLASDTKYRWFIIGTVIFISFWVLFLTETRSILLLYPFLLFCALLQSRLFSVQKAAMIGLIAGILIIATIYFAFPNAQQRLLSIFTEVQSFQHDHGDSSIGARLSMWQAGIMAIMQHPWGLGSHERLELVTQLMIQNGNNGSEALRNAVYHLHNDFIESMSLQGVTGGVALFYFYSVFFSFFLDGKGVNRAVLFFPLPILLICMVDSLFIQDRFVTILVMGTAIYTVLSTVNERRRPV